MTPAFEVPAELAELADEYELVDELGRGGSAIVYRARDRARGRDVAIKVVHPRPASSDDDQVARLAREARTVAQLQHPGIVTVYAVHRLHTGGLTLVMPFVPGLTLKAAIQRGGPFDPDRAADVLRDVAHALAYAHARQVVHRDVKPENIFLDAETGRALLADFGIARSAEAESLTMTGTAIGTPFYMSPEQVDGKPVDGRSDLYSLGLVAWEMLTGVRPWDGESLYHVIYKQKHDELPPIEALRRDVPRRLQYVVERMLQKHPAARWAGADGFLAQLDETVLPADYGQWQAALPGRVARHRAVSGLQRGTPKSPDPTVFAAATVQFASAGDRAANRADSRERIQIPVGSEPSVLSATAIAVGAAPATDAPANAWSEPPLSSPEGATADDEPRPAYDSIAPTWVYADVDVPRRASGRWRRRAVGAVALAGVAVGAMALTSKATDPRPTQRTTHGRTAAASVTKVGAIGSALAQRWSARVAATDSAPAVSAPTVFAPIEHTPDLLGVGEHHLCSLTLAETAQCWGENDKGQLGDGSRLTSARLPRSVVGVMHYSALGAGGAHTCGVTEPGDVYCWGSNGDGQLGDGTTIRRSAPVRVAGTGTYRVVRGGRAHTCALDVGGQVRCWGANGRGQLGDGTRDSRSIPAPVHLPAQASATAIAVGDEHSCAVLNDERVLSWGSNDSGQLGRGSDSESDLPVEVLGVHASTIAAGSAHTCVVLSAGPIRCWGRNEAGQLGTGAVDANAAGRLTTIPGGEDVRALTAGDAHSCALTRGGWAWCWGRTRAGARRTPSRVGRGPYVALVAGGGRSCAIPRGRVAECWFAADAMARVSRAVAGGRPPGS